MSNRNTTDRCGTWRRLTTGSSVARLAAVLLGVVSLGAFVATSANAGLTYLPKKLALKTHTKYGSNCLWAPPKGMDYINLPGAIPIQKPNLYPDVGSTYFVAQYKLPAGASLTFQGKFGYQRYMSWTMFGRPGELGQIASADRLRDVWIKPDKGSYNPFKPKAKRFAKKPRKYTMHIVSGPIPAKRAPNTLYTQTTDPDVRLGMSIRNYLPDRGRDGTGDAGLPTFTLNLADGTRLKGKAACEMLDPIKDPSGSTFPPGLWKDLVAASPDPANAPAASKPKWEKFFNALYNVAGIFISDQQLREQTYPPTESGGFQANPDTSYLLTPISMNFGNVLVIKGKMPTFPKSLPAARRWNPKKPQVRYWSLCSGSAPVSGLGYDCVYDQQVPINRKRMYTIVVSSKANRPANARPACGYHWIDFGAGENYGDPAERDHVGNMYMRFMAADTGWKQAPQNVKRPGTEKTVMGAYFPTSKYSYKAEFQKLGCKKAR